jgi:hypothetical protein
MIPRSGRGSLARARARRERLTRARRDAGRRYARDGWDAGCGGPRP